jgi:signal transduction histidine kinase
VAPPLLPLAAGILGQVLACVCLFRVGPKWRIENDPADLAVALAATAWLLYLQVMTALVWLEAPPAIIRAAAFIGAQLLTFCVGLLLTLWAKILGRGMLLVLVLHALCGAATLYLLLVPSAGLAEARAYPLWVLTNVLASAIVLSAIALALRERPSVQRWLALAGCTFGLSMWIDHLARGGPAVLPATFTQFFFAMLLLITWHVAPGPVPQLHLSDSDPASGFGPSSGFDHVSGFGPGVDLAATAVANERRRIAQDLHDNVAASIVNLLASLETRGSRSPTPVTVALEQLLLDLKMTVDAIDSTTDSLPEALGRLRHRIQRSLDALGIRMVWKVMLSDELDAVRGPVAVHSLRIAQECLTNVIRHSGASSVVVGCRYDTVASAIVLEVRDNGCGIARGSGASAGGRGLKGMRQRAAAAGGTLVILSKVGIGTRVRLIVPFIQRRSGSM